MSHSLKGKLPPAIANYIHDFDMQRAKQPTIIEETHAAKDEAALCKWWRTNVVKMSRRDLSKVTGYSVEAIQKFECGYTSKGNPHTVEALLRYRMACVGIVVNPQFKWEAHEQR